MSERSSAKCAAAMLAAGAWLFVTANAQAVEPYQPGAAANKTLVAASDVCDPAQGACAKIVIAVEATGPMSLEELGPFARYGVGSRCHPAYTPSWLACAKRAGTMKVAVLTQ